MLNQKIEDRYGNELTVGSEVLFSDAFFGSKVFEGKIDAETKGSFRICNLDNGTGIRVYKKDAKLKLILNPYKK